jgi:hypothetical protein
MATPGPPGGEKDNRTEAFENEYKQSHPNGPYPPVEIKGKTEAKST